MQVVIFCGGLGTRLKEETEFRPKPMVPIGGRPIIWHIMQIYSRYGHKEFILALGYKGEMIKEYFYNYEVMNSDLCIEFGLESKMTIYPRHEEVAGWKVTLVDTGAVSQKGARLKKVEKYVTGKDFFVTYGDGLSNINLDDLVSYHASHGRIATLSGVSPGSQFGEMRIKDGRVVRFREKPDMTSQIVNGGFYVMNRRIFSYLSTEDSCDLEFNVLEQLADEGELMAYHHPGRWACMDNLRDVEYLNKLWSENKAFWSV
jgi:glucose-1-phosphate cytidylyltransferase